MTLALLTASLGGCGFVKKITRGLQPQDKLSIETAQGKTVRQTFEKTSYADRAGGLVDIALTSESVSENASVGAVSVTFLIRLQWRHEPGRTVIDVSSTNSILRYRIQTASGWREYRGAGAVKVTGSWGGRLRVELRNATVRPVGGGGELRDVYGPAMFSGRFTAARDEQAVSAAIMTLRRD